MISYLEAYRVTVGAIHPHEAETVCVVAGDGHEPGMVRPLKLVTPIPGGH